MNRNSKLIKRGLTTSLAVGMSVMVGAMPVYAASSDKKDNDDKLYKEETVYVNADAAGNTDEITVSNWLKNSGDVSGKLTDKSTLNDIKNVKGDEKYTADGDSDCNRCLLSHAICCIQTCFNDLLQILLCRHVRFEFADTAAFFHCFYYFIHIHDLQSIFQTTVYYI